MTLKKIILTHIFVTLGFGVDLNLTSAHAKTVDDVQLSMVQPIDLTLSTTYVRNQLNGLYSIGVNSMTDNINKSRRTLLLSTGAVGVVGAGFAAVPFLKSWLPSERAKAMGGPVKANISKVEPGQMLSVLWRGQPVFLVNRTEEQTGVLEKLNDRLKDPTSESSIQPDYIDSIFRARKDNFLVIIGICTHLGCVPSYFPELVPQKFDNEWKGGFFCPCHSSMFDISGRVFYGSPAGRNLDIPPHTYLDNNTIEIGVDGEQV